MIAVGVTNPFYCPEQNKYIGKPVGACYGGHGIAIVSYDDEITYTFADGTVEKGFFEIQNSWDKTWANGGFAYIPYSSLSWVLSNGLSFVTEIWSCVDYKPSYWRIQAGAFGSKIDAQTYPGPTV